MVLASDGVWEFITSQEAVDIISRHNTAEEACRHVSLRFVFPPAFGKGQSPRAFWLLLTPLGSAAAVPVASIDSRAVC